MAGTRNFLLLSIIALLTLAFAAPVLSPSKPKNDNPPPQKDNFSQWPNFGEGQAWRYHIVNGNGANISVNGTLPFDNSTAEVTPGKELHFLQIYDPDFDEEYPDQYNNIFMIGFQGYVPNTARDILWNFDMKLEPGIYGTTGFVIERKNTFASDGNFALPFDFFGVTYAGEENYSPGLHCGHLDDFMTVSQDPIADVDPFAWNAYEIRFHLVESETVLASISVNNIEVCQRAIENYGETEIQVWLDNYKVIYDPSNPLGFTFGYSNKETPQGVLYDNIEVKAKPTH